MSFAEENKKWYLTGKDYYIRHQYFLRFIGILGLFIDRRDSLHCPSLSYQRYY